MISDINERVTSDNPHAPVYSTDIDFLASRTKDQSLMRFKAKVFVFKNLTEKLTEIAKHDLTNTVKTINLDDLANKLQKGKQDDKTTKDLIKVREFLEMVDGILGKKWDKSILHNPKLGSGDNQLFRDLEAIDQLATDYNR